MPRAEKGARNVTSGAWGIEMRELVEFLTRSIVDKPEEVEVREVDGARSILLEIRVAPEDVGKVIGRRGRLIKSIRTLARSAALKKGKRVEVEVLR